MSAAAPDGVRYWLPTANPGVYKALVALQRASADGLDRELVELIKIRASQLNGCAYCLHMHLSDALGLGMEPITLGMVGVWRECLSMFDEKSRAALELTEYVTRIGDDGVPEEVYERVRSVFGDEAFGQVLASIVMINVWNRIALTGCYPAGLDERTLRS
ncbi:carboxymuconolactone decarboxylase family protein [Gordonia oryzae]|uniref:Carboxymuconolactone decarboxylase family protein n=1 Tax=Gordonia oryzae TaxID=2487349 RepID=A0A3N4GSM7_9ACTN|nr:carboxymuconolactone decarboxylase family protein [Gordonia oryzae]RPA65275.1 carboxymuconolactone decarboxylase family protein [Gordonia oryzae]